MVTKKELGKFQQSLVLLDMQLRELCRSSRLSMPEYTRRTHQLKHLKQLLSRVGHGEEPNYGNLIEANIFLIHWREKAEILQILKKESLRIRRCVDKTLLGGWRFFSIIYLSRLRTLLRKMDSMHGQLQRDRVVAEKFSNSLLGLLERFFPEAPKNSMPSLLHALESLHEDIQRMRTQVVQDRVELEKQKDWLVLQKEKVATGNILQFFENRMQKRRLQ